jgi:Luciferase-like monooxygenase
MSFAESRPRYEEALDLLTLAWTQERFSYEGRYYHAKDVTVVPKPLQKPHPKIYMVRTSEASFIAAGTRGVSIAAGGPVPYAVYAPGIGGYKKACAERGYTPDISFIRLVYLDEDAQQIRKEAEQYVRNFLDFNASAIDSLTHRKEELIATGYGLYTSGMVERWRQTTYDQCIEEELCFIGTPEQVIAQIRRLDQQIGGLNEMVIISNFGGIEHWKAIKTQHLFAQYVMRHSVRPESRSLVSPIALASLVDMSMQKAQPLIREARTFTNSRSAGSRPPVSTSCCRSHITFAAPGGAAGGVSVLEPAAYGGHKDASAARTPASVAPRGCCWG